METTRRRFRRARIAAAIAAGITGLATWTACSVEKHYELLSTFFDGVPEPDAEGTGATGSAARGRTLLTVPTSVASRHSAYVERRCAECHGDRARFGFVTEGFSEITAAVCVTCHDVGAADAFAHGPSAAGLCLACHQPHVSPYPMLLVDRSPALCLDCHAPDMLETTAPGSVHGDLERDCLECHGAHGGDNRYFLHEEWPVTADGAPPGPGP